MTKAVLDFYKRRLARLDSKKDPFDDTADKDGGPGSGHHKHVGRAGLRGGSAPAGSASPQRKGHQYVKGNQKGDDGIYSIDVSGASDEKLGSRYKEHQKRQRTKAKKTNTPVEYNINANNSLQFFRDANGNIMKERDDMHKKIIKETLGKGLNQPHTKGGAVQTFCMGIPGTSSFGDVKGGVRDIDVERLVAQIAREEEAQKEENNGRLAGGSKSQDYTTKSLFTANEENHGTLSAWYSKHGDASNLYHDEASRLAYAAFRTATDAGISSRLHTSGYSTERLLEMYKLAKENGDTVNVQARADDAASAWEREVKRYNNQYNNYIRALENGSKKIGNPPAMIDEGVFFHLYYQQVENAVASCESKDVDKYDLSITGKKGEEHVIATREKKSDGTYGLRLASEKDREELEKFLAITDGNYYIGEDGFVTKAETQKTYAEVESKFFKNDPYHYNMGKVVGYGTDPQVKKEAEKARQKREAQKAKEEEKQKKQKEAEKQKKQKEKKQETPKAEEKKQETPKAEEKKQETPKEEEKKQETPKAEEKKQETPKEAKQQETTEEKKPKATKQKNPVNESATGGDTVSSEGKKKRGGKRETGGEKKVSATEKLHQEIPQKIRGDNGSATDSVFNNFSRVVSKMKSLQSTNKTVNPQGVVDMLQAGFSALGSSKISLGKTSVADFDNEKGFEPRVTSNGDKKKVSFSVWDSDGASETMKLKNGSGTVFADMYSLETLREFVDVFDQIAGKDGKRFFDQKEIEDALNSCDIKKTLQVPNGVDPKYSLLGRISNYGKWYQASFKNNGGEKYGTLSDYLDNTTREGDGQSDGTEYETSVCLAQVLNNISGGELSSKVSLPGTGGKVKDTRYSTPSERCSNLMKDAITMKMFYPESYSQLDKLYPQLTKVINEKTESLTEALKKI